MKTIEKEANIDANKKLNNLRNKLNKDIKEQNQELNTKTQNIDTKKEQVKPGITVYVENLGQQGTVISNVSKDEQVLVQIGSLKMKVQIQNLRIIKDIEPKKQNNISQNYTKINKTRNAKTEINVIGMNVEEARFVVEKFLDDSILAHLQTVRIVHGKGTGKTFDWNLLKNIQKTDKLLFLAGGLTPENAAQAVKTVAPDVVDVSSGVEKDVSPCAAFAGKDAEKITKFVENVRL